MQQQHPKTAVLARNRSPAWHLGSCCDESHTGPDTLPAPRSCFVVTPTAVPMRREQAVALSYPSTAAASTQQHPPPRRRSRGPSTQGSAPASSANRAVKGLGPAPHSLLHQFSVRLSQLGAGVPEESVTAPKSRPSLYLMISLRI